MAVREALLRSDGTIVPGRRIASGQAWRWEEPGCKCDRSALRETGVASRVEALEGCSWGHMGSD